MVLVKEFALWLQIADGDNGDWGSSRKKILYRDTQIPRNHLTEARRFGRNSGNSPELRAAAIKVSVFVLEL